MSVVDQKTTDRLKDVAVCCSCVQPMSQSPHINTIAVPMIGLRTFQVFCDTCQSCRQTRECSAFVIEVLDDHFVYHLKSTLVGAATTELKRRLDDYGWQPAGVWTIGLDGKQVWNCSVLVEDGSGRTPDLGHTRIDIKNITQHQYDEIREIYRMLDDDWLRSPMPLWLIERLVFTELKIEQERER